MMIRLHYNHYSVLRVLDRYTLVLQDRGNPVPVRGIRKVSGCFVKWVYPDGG